MMNKEDEELIMIFTSFSFFFCVSLLNLFLFRSFSFSFLHFFFLFHFIFFLFSSLLIWLPRSIVFFLVFTIFMLLFFLHSTDSFPFSRMNVRNKHHNFRKTSSQKSFKKKTYPSERKCTKNVLILAKQSLVYHKAELFECSACF